MMGILSVSSTNYSPYFSCILAGKSRNISSSITFSCKSSPEPDASINSPGNIRRPKTVKTSPSKSSTSANPRIRSNPLRNLVNPPKTPDNSDNLSNKLWLSSRLSPPPPPQEAVSDGEESSDEDETQASPNGSSNHVSSPEFRQEGKIFVGNLPLWIKKNEVAAFFRQFGPIKNVILIKGYDDPERNVGYCFIIYGGPTAANSAAKAVEFDGVEFHGRVLTVKLDDGRRLKTRSEERSKWVAGSDGREYRSKWHEERENSRQEFRKVLEAEPENWQAVVRAFERIKKPSRREFGLMVNYYARRGDMHRAREAFESMRARGIEPTSHVYTNGQRHGGSIILCEENEGRGHRDEFGDLQYTCGRIC